MQQRSNPFPCGVVEGFYGRSWPHETRLAYSDLLIRMGLNTYLYCPKNDPHLRSQWREDWPVGERERLLEIGGRYAEQGLAWGIGLSPVALYTDYGASARRTLRERVLSIADLGVDILAILFDDMPGDFPALAQRQAEIIADVAVWIPNIQIMMCPTYYSFDPVLERYFGQMPENYWAELGQELPPNVHVFWTGNEVCSAGIAVRDIKRIMESLGRQVTLWDNYPVNDGASRSNHLYLDPLPGREAGLAELLGGHLCNPMNQGFASLPALNGLARLYGAGLTDREMSNVIGATVWSRLQRDADEFLTLGLSGMGEPRCADLAAQYRRQPGAAAREVAEWLEGEYAFDPACLTD